MIITRKLVCSLFFTLIIAGSALAQPAPIRRAVVPANEAPESMTNLFADLGSGERVISIPGATWIQLQFRDVLLGSGGTMTITSPSGETQNFTQAELDAWGGLTAVFNGAELTVRIDPGSTPSGPVSARLADIIIGVPPAPAGATEAAQQPLIAPLGDDLERFLPDDVRSSAEDVAPALRAEGAPGEGQAEAICGANDDRVASNDPRSGRIVPVGCTGWLIDSGLVLTAGHCVGATAQTLEFNVPASQANGAIVAAAVRDQYRIIAGSFVTENTGIGNDWAIFRVLPNTQTNLLPPAAQGGTFQISNSENPGTVRITGYGVDGPAPTFGAGGPRDATNQTQQTHVASLSTNTGGANSGTLRYNVDTQGGNSGSPVIVEGSSLTIGIHTNGGCGVGGGTNAGTSFRNQALWSAISDARRGGTADIAWQHIGGQVHYWPIRNGQRQGGIDIGASGPVGNDWALRGVGDVDGDGTDDVVWQHVFGQVHYWPIRNGHRQGGINIGASGPVGNDWALRGVGDVDGDGTDDIVWQHVFGQVHYWPIRNGQRQGGIDIGASGPVGNDWALRGVGDVDGDGTDDIVWQHIGGQVHYWPIRNGQRQGGIDIGASGPVGNDWALRGVGDVDGDGTDDIVWQHIGGQVHYWPIRNGRRQGGIDIGASGPVGNDWVLRGVGDLDGQ